MENQIPFPDLLQEMIDLSNKYKAELFNKRVLRVYCACWRAGKLNICEAIKRKYPQAIMLRDDRALAFAYALAAAKHFGLDDELMP